GSRIVFVKDHAVEGGSQLRPLADDVGVAAAVPGRVDDRSPVAWKVVESGHQLGERRRVVRVVDDDGRSALFENVDPAGLGGRDGVKVRELGANGFVRNPQTPRGGRGRQHVFDVKRDAPAEGQRHPGYIDEGRLV